MNVKKTLIENLDDFHRAVIDTSETDSMKNLIGVVVQLIKDHDAALRSGAGLPAARKPAAKKRRK